MLTRLFRRLGEEPLSYDRSKELARDRDPEVRRRLASRTDLRPEILYYLAEDEAAAVRREIAANAATPGQANLLLAGDADDEVRCELARKIGRLLPDLPDDAATKVRDLAIKTIEVLARDQLPRVRAILAEEIKHSDLVPHAVVVRLARDVETIVAAPILEYSPLLSDNDLLEIIAAGAGEGRLPAIARRRGVSSPVADAVAGTLDIPAVAALLANPSAQIREETLDLLIDHAAGIESWHEPLVRRDELSVRAIRRIAGFVAAALIDILAARHDLDSDTQTELRQAVRRRIDKPQSGAEEAPADRARELAAAGRLDDECICLALDRNQRGFVVHALAQLAGVAPALVEKVAEARSAKAITALAWKAGLSMRTAMRLQMKLALIPPQQMLNARNGVDYPLSSADLQQQWSFLAE
jgi:uncharacterized protein (DUF2336 family)